MSRSYWSIYTLGSSNNWEDSGETLPRPNADLNVAYQNNFTKIQLSNGKFCYLSPENNVILQPVVFIWNLDYDWAISKQIKGYIDNNTFMKIVTHNTDISFIGRFSDLSSSWLVGVTSPTGGDDFDVSATFEQMDETAY